MNNFELTNIHWTIIISAFILWILIVFLFYRWAYRRNGILGVLLLFFLSLIGALILLLFVPPNNNKGKK